MPGLNGGKWKVAYQGLTGHSSPVSVLSHLKLPPPKKKKKKDYPVLSRYFLMFRSQEPAVFYFGFGHRKFEMIYFVSILSTT